MVKGNSNAHGRCRAARTAALLGSGLAAGFLFLVLAAPASAQRGFVRPIGVRLVAYVNGAPEGVRPEYTWYLNNKNHQYKVDIVKLTVFEGGLLPGDIDSRLVLYQYQLMLAGDETTLQRFRAIPPKEEVTIQGYLRFEGGARIFMLSRLEPVPTPSPKQGVIDGGSQK